MSESGIIRRWTDGGWGVIDSPSVPGGCWAHFSLLASGSFWEPAPGDPVGFEFEAVNQDGFRFRATRVWPAGSEPVDDQPEPPGHAYTSELTIDID